MPIDMPPFDVPPGYERRASGLISKGRKMIRGMTLPGMTFPMPTFMPAGLTPAAIAGTNTSSGVNFITHSAALPDSIASGDLLLIFISLASSYVADSRTISTPSGWTSEVNVAGPGYLKRYVVFSKTATGSEGSTVSISASGPSHWAVASMRISPTLTAEYGSATTGTSAAPDASSVSPSWGASEQTLFLVGTACFPARTVTPPSGYATSATIADDLFYSRVHVSYRTAFVSSEDPAAHSTSLSSYWGTSSIAIRGG